MKKFIIVLLCTFIILFNNFSTFNINAKEIDDRVLDKYETATRIEKKKEEPKEVVNSTIKTSINTQYVKETNNVYETHSINYGTYGRLYVSWYDVALYDYNVYTSSSSSLQQLVDNYDSAAFYANKGRLVIADHDNQGFRVLTSLSEGTTSYIKFEDGRTITYRLIKKEKGYNTGPDLVDTNGNSFYDMESSLIMYTCYGDGIMVTLWILV